MNATIILILEIAQGIWWLVLCLMFGWKNQIITITLSSSAIVIQLGLLIALRKMTNNVHLIRITLLFLINTIVYTELNLQIHQYLNPFANHTNTLIIVSNQYIIDEIVTLQISYRLLKFGYPCYIILRLFSVLFINFDYYILESIIVIFFIVMGHEKQQLLFSFRLSVQADNNTNFINQLKQSQNKNKKLQQSSQLFIHDNQKDKLSNFSNQTNKNQSSDQFFAIVGNSLRKRVTVDVDKTESQLNVFFNHLMDYFTQGVVILNQFQQIQYMNKKCQRLLLCQGEEQILYMIKESLNNTLLKNKNSLSISPTSRKLEMNQQILEDIFNQASKRRLSLDIFDVLLNQQKYLAQYYPRQCNFDGENSSAQDSPYSNRNSNQYTFYLTFQTDRHIKLSIILSQFSNQQLDSIIQGSKPLFGDQIQQPYIFLLMKNITHKNQIEKIKKYNQQSSEMLNTFSFELRTPLNIISQVVSITKDLTIEQQAIREYLELMQCSNSILYHSINDILDYSSIQSNMFHYKFNLFQIQDVIQEIEHIFIQQVKQKNVQFSTKIQSCLLDKQIYSDKQRIIQVIINILNYSYHQAKSGGEMSLSLFYLDEQRIQITVHHNEILQNGNSQAIPQQIILKNKENDRQFNLTQNPELGLGLNLSAKLVQGLVDTNDNYVEIVTCLQTGTSISFWIQDLDLSQSQEQIFLRGSLNTGKFMTCKKSRSLQDDNFIIRRYSDYIVQDDHFYLQKKGQKPDCLNSNDSPKIVDDLNEKIKVPQQNYFQFKSLESPILGNKTFSFKYSTLQTHECTSFCKRILIVDDQVLNLIAFKALLNHYQIQCDSAYDGNQAVQRVKEKMNTQCQFYEVIFMDIEMPGMNGFETSKEIIKQGGKKPTIIMCSAYDTKENMNQSDHQGMSEFLPKPVNKFDLLRILKKYQLVR
ncbi:unnamed protein product (macronuclear) [Paramecium tetraurelia]|uniref:Response regulatory domain-containing protein n=1 Tax=Paramecium tetraurelia TaxID=5888 RepID=A0DDI3_PARTE|nr:uncharacterized protein GSPATT00015960001 [Paramecium tetraurelia]CAK81100.1 unnamed protein product [Paramecium tetraurelia]|eukprot:XP_001448497.1 hypothetical protein (macronuclear) [Paramecium tetraurelia strain d4-2]